LHVVIDDLPPSGIDRGRRLPTPVESPVASAMTGKALFHGLAAERRHGDVPGNGDGGITPLALLAVATGTRSQEGGSGFRPAIL
jgi:hypothetical protein